MRVAFTCLACWLSICLVQWGNAAEIEPSRLDGTQRAISAPEVMDVKQGTVAVWVRFLEGHPRRDHCIFHTDDSRFVLFVDTYYSRGLRRDIVRIGGRAGGNRRAVDSSFKLGNFPEASIIIDNDGSLSDYGKGSDWSSPAPFPEGAWHHVAMTWKGYPDGVVTIYLDGKRMGRKAYDSRYDDGRPLPRTIAIGERPAEWTGEIVKNRDGETADLRPSSSMSLVSGGIDISDLRLYRSDLSQDAIVRLVKAGRQPNR